MSLNASDAGERRLATAAAVAWVALLVVAAAALSLGLGRLPAHILGAFVVMAVPALSTAALLAAPAGGRPKKTVPRRRGAA